SLPLPATARLRRLTFDGCCAGAWWSRQRPDRLYTLDGAPGQRAAIFFWDVGETAAFGLEGAAPPPFTSADGAVVIAPLNDQAFTLRYADGSETTVSTGGSFPSLSADNSRLFYTVSGGASEAADEPPKILIGVANADGSDARVAAVVAGGSARWLDDRRLLPTAREELITRLSVLDAETGESFELGQWERLRGLSIAPGGGRLMFYLTNQSDPAASGVYSIETRAGASAERLPWFGAWRWRDSDSVYYLPFEPESPAHHLRLYHLPTSEDRALTDPTSQPFLVANGDWSVSYDGTRIAFLNAFDSTTWLIEIR
ncbi:MAG: hypothetical protein HUU31_24865, partial [Anaerolineae bacterium]|nr:hypothetical protein [Anaerolineae bacterium]